MKFTQQKAEGLGIVYSLWTERREWCKPTCTMALRLIITNFDWTVHLWVQLHSLRMEQFDWTVKMNHDTNIMYRE